MIRPLGYDALDEWYDTRGADSFGGITAVHRDEAWLTDEEVAEIERDRRERLAKKRPVGFAPWPEDRP